MTAPLSSLLPKDATMIDHDYSSTFSSMDERPEAIVVWIFGAIAVLAVGLVVGLGFVL